MFPAIKSLVILERYDRWYGDHVQNPFHHSILIRLI